MQGGPIAGRRWTTDMAAVTVPLSGPLPAALRPRPTGHGGFFGATRAAAVVVATLLMLSCSATAGEKNDTCINPSSGSRCTADVTIGGKSLTIESMPQRLLDAEYAVRGEIVTRSFKLEKMLAEGNHGLPFDELVPCNIGNPQAVGAKPLTFHRQVLSLLSNPVLLEDPGTAKLYPEDVLARAKEYLGGYPNFGAYSHSKGVALFRQKVADYIDRRDGSKVPPADIEDIYLTDGASAGVKTVLETMIDGPLDGVLIPIPQYPLYSASITRLGGTSIGYELLEDYMTGRGWGVDVGIIDARIKEFLATGGRVRAIAVINPGNPVGNVMPREEIEAVVRLCAKYSIVILADEVYQENVWRPDKQFISFRQVILEMGSSVELFSFHSMSKGYYGECGLRGGVLHLTNIDPAVNDQIYKLFSMILCSNTLGQAMMASILNPPLPGAPSHEVFRTERDHILEDLRRKSELVHRELNAMEGVQCLPVDGAMYAFPEVAMPKRFLAEAEAEGKAPDLLYCIKILEATGVMVVPGSGFGQRPGSWHYRITILPQEDKLRKVLGRMRKFHQEFLATYLEPGERLVEDKTPSPCLPKYSEALHKEVIEEHLRNATQGQDQPHMLLLLGGAGAGKSTFLRAAHRHGFAVADFVMQGLDQYIEYLPEYKATLSSQRVVYKDAADGCYPGAIPIAKAALAELIKRRQHAVYEDTGKDLDRIMKRVLPPFEEAGYRITVVLVDNLPEVAKERAPLRFMASGRYSSDEYISSTYRDVPENYDKLRNIKQVHESIYCDNSCRSGSARETGEEGGCLKCWLDKGPLELLPASLLQPGNPVRLSTS